MRFCAWSLAACLPLVALAQPADVAPSIAELMLRVDPAEDHWIAESLQAEAAKRLERLAALLETRSLPDAESGILAREAKSTRLRPGSLERQSVAGGFEVLRGGASSEMAVLPVATALSGLLAPLGAADTLRVSFKVTGVELLGDAGLRTRVRYEAAGRSGAGVIQQIAYWSVSWARGIEQALLLKSIRLESYEEVSRDGFQFRNATASVLPASARELLEHGGEFWYGRIDALGEPNLMGHQGIAVGDFNGDGLEDLYVAMGTGLPNLLLVQQRDGSVRDVAEQAGVAWLDDTKGVLFADTDNDGDQDLLMAIGPTIVLAKNDGKGRFERFVSMRAPTPAPFYSLTVADYDLDGDLDIYGARYVEVAYGISVPMPFHDAENGPTNHLMRNEGDDRFTDVTLPSGLGVHNTRFSLIGAWGDYDRDGDPDLYVANDFGRNNLYRNDGGRFTDVAAEAGTEDQAAGMGASWSDYDRDGDLDLYVTNMYSAAGNRIAYQPRFQRAHPADVRLQVQRHSSGNSLFVNQGDGTFRDASDEAGVRMGRWGWGARFVDLDNDGFDDLVVPNGFLSGAIEDDL
jgi:hypothetical protein